MKKRDQIACVSKRFLAGSDLALVSWSTPLSQRDSGFLLVSVDDPEEPGDDEEFLQAVHLGCLVDEHPELGQALDVARRQGLWLAEA